MPTRLPLHQISMELSRDVIYGRREIAEELLTEALYELRANFEFCLNTRMNGLESTHKGTHVDLLHAWCLLGLETYCKGLSKPVRFSHHRFGAKRSSTSDLEIDYLSFMAFLQRKQLPLPASLYPNEACNTENLLSLLSAGCDPWQTTIKVADLRSKSKEILEHRGQGGEFCPLKEAVDTSQDIPRSFTEDSTVTPITADSQNMPVEEGKPDSPLVNSFHSNLARIDPSAENIFIDCEDWYAVRFEGGKIFNVKKLDGLFYIAYLLRHQGNSISPNELYMQKYPPPSETTDATICQRSATALEELRLSVTHGLEYKTDSFDDHGGNAYVRKLQDEHKRSTHEREELLATEYYDESELERIDKYLDFISSEAKRIHYIKKHPNKHEKNSPTEKIRKNVGARIKGGIEAIGKHSETLKQHLEGSIKKSTTCYYRPQKRTDWLLQLLH